MINEEDIFIEADIYAIIEKLNSIEKHFIQRIPGEMLYKEDGSPNIRTRWGAALYHLRYMRSTLRSFL